MAHRGKGADYSRKSWLIKALESIAPRSSDGELVTYAAERLVMAERARVAVETVIEERGEQNQTLTIASTLVPLFGIVIAVAGPSSAVIIRGFGI
jgi:hypothetical protein